MNLECLLCSLQTVSLNVNTESSIIRFHEENNLRISGLKIVIIGSGEIGFHLGKVLSEELHDVTILDHDIDTLQKVSEYCDVLTVEGEGTSIRDLLAAGVDKADLVVAATDIDEVNMVIAMIVKRLGKPRVIARIRNDELCSPESPLSPSDIGIDVLIHPEEHVAREIVRLIKRAAASELVGLADDRLQLIGLRLDKSSHLIDQTMEAFAQSSRQIPFRVVAILRGGRTIIPDGSSKFKFNDQIFMIAHSNDVPRVIALTGRQEKTIKRIMIAGGSVTGERVTRLLADEPGGWSIKLIEPDYEKSLRLAGKYRDVLVLHGEPTDPDLLVSEGIGSTDAFISVTPDEESNIISCLLAKHLGVSKTVALVSRADYIPMSQSIGLDAAVNKKLSVTNEIHRQIRTGRVISNYSPYGTNAEILELQVSENSHAAGREVEKLKLPPETIIGAVIHNGRAVIATGKTTIQNGDHVIVFCNPESLNQVTGYFS